MNRILAVLIFLSTACYGKAQINSDSLWGAWENQNESAENRMNALHILTEARYLFVNPDSTLILAQLQLDLAKENADVFRQARSIRLMGMTHREIGEFDLALEEFNRALQMVITIDRPEEWVNLLTDIGHIFRLKGQYYNAEKYFKQGISVSDSLNLRLSKAYLSNHMGILQKKSGNLSAAIESYTNSLLIAEQENDTRLVTSSLANIAALHYELEDYESSLFLFRTRQNTCRKSK